MNRPLSFQLIALLLVSIVLAFLNNLRPNAAIQWVRDWPEYSKLSAENVERMESPPVERPATEPAEEKGADPDQGIRQATDFVIENVGITDIDLDRAAQIHQYANEITFWIDARSPELFEEGHIQGAQLLHLYEKQEYLPLVEAEIQASQPVALVVYCKGKDCTDSHHLAQDLNAVGYDNIFVYRGGFDDWYQAGYPIEGRLAPQSGPSEAVTPRTPLETKPPGMYLEHIMRDLAPFLLGLLLLVFWKRTSISRTWIWIASITVGLFFIYAAVSKIDNPFLFAKNIWNYAIAPAPLINLSALLMPMLELTAGICLVSGLFRRGGGLIVSGLLLIFILAVGYNVLRGHQFNCGCTATTTMFTDIYLAGWNDKITLLLRDFGLLVMSWMAFLFREK